ncbi:MAG TPA: GntR family transcriptional regulator [Candidatus Limnocylindria bacterium]|nr:GntR family transcriptional regulator [Candidatus Limnocylindria bacterium]
MSASTGPRYREIERALRGRIATLRPGDRLPSEAELCLEFGVSRMTAREAMHRLAEEGLVSRVPGRGSYVAEPAAHRRADRLMSFSEEIRRQGRVPSSIVLTREIRPADAAAAGLLGLLIGQPVVLLQRVRCADGQPIALERAQLVGGTSPAVMAADLRVESLHAVLAAAGWLLRRGTATVSAEAATAADARHLRVARGEPMLVERRVILDGAGKPVEATESRYAAARYAIDVRFEVPDLPVPISPEAEAR